MADSLFIAPHRHATAVSTAGGHDEAAGSSAAAESARHAVLRRLAPALKHDMVVNLQAISMMAEMMQARLDRGLDDTRSLQGNISKLNRLARDAVLKCLDASTWIAPGEDDTIALQQGVDECIALLNGSMTFRGFQLSREAPMAEFQVARQALRALLPAAVIVLTDAAAGGEVHVRAELAAGHASITVTCNPAREGGEDVDAPLPRIGWSDLQALAAAESVELFRNGSQVVLRMPRALPSSPLQMVPM